MAAPHILVLGSLNTDLITRTPVVPTGGETLTASSFSTGCGGKGANQAVACARASRKSTSAKDGSEPVLAQVSMVGAVGDDLYGNQLKSELASNGVSTEGVEVIKDQVSGVAVIIVEESSGENRIMFTPGANGRVVPAAFDSFVAKQRPDLVVMQLEVPLETVLAVVEKCKTLGIDCLLNPAPAVPLPDSALNGLAHLVLNETEAGILAGWKGAVEEDSLKPVFQKFEALGVQNTIITLGSKGVAWGLGGGKFDLLPAEKVKQVVDTTAAGDTFVGAYAVQVAQSKLAGSELDLRATIAKANRAAARTVEKAGAMQSIAWLDEY